MRASNGWAGGGGTVALAVLRARDCRANNVPASRAVVPVPPARSPVSANARRALSPTPPPQSAPLTVIALPIASLKVASWLPDRVQVSRSAPKTGRPGDRLPRW
ncbi:hypothetical protein CKY47_25730 [Saccharothrix yanglingensis]|uniref:Secreted protein n=1 Tax=Saccharothrix yanglingensis TaxID=659496 RepID=A0ABU0X7V1_9PSEU|nr:hypothetical protein [Saccharothrix yanglingensis]